MKLYIAGPITGVPDYEERFKKAEEDLKAMGHTVINPVKDKGFTYKEIHRHGPMPADAMRCHIYAERIREIKRRTP